MLKFLYRTCTEKGFSHFFNIVLFRTNNIKNNKSLWIAQLL